MSVSDLSLNDFSKELSGEVRTLIKEVGDLRECRRALYVELAELLLMKGRQNQGDMLAIMPYPTKPPPKPVEQKKKDEKNNPKAPPMWSTMMMPMAPGLGRGLPPIPGPPPMHMPMPFGPGPGPSGPAGVPFSMLPGQPGAMGVSH